MYYMSLFCSWPPHLHVDEEAKLSSQCVKILLVLHIILKVGDPKSFS